MIHKLAKVTEEGLFFGAAAKIPPYDTVQVSNMDTSLLPLRIQACCVNRIGLKLVQKCNCLLKMKKFADSNRKFTYM
jgi:hypothetical protein